MEKKLIEEINNIRSIMGLDVIKEDYDSLPKIVDLYPNVDFHSRTKEDRLNPNILSDIQKAAKNAGIKVTVNYARTGHGKFTDSGAISRHWRGLAVDVSQVQGSGWNSRDDARKKGIVVAIDRFVEELRKLGYKINRGESPSLNKVVLGFGFKNHHDHVHVSNTKLVSGDYEDTEVDDEETDNVEDYDDNIDDTISMEELKNLKNYLLKKGKEIGKEKINKIIEALKKLQSMKFGDFGTKIKDALVTAIKTASESE